MKVRSRSCPYPLGKHNGFALVLTLILVVLAAVTVVAFLSTTLTERTTAAAYGRINKADFFAEAGANAAIARVVTEMTYRPYHAIGYRVVNTGINTEVIPVITGPRTTNPSTPTYNTAPDPNEDVYLISVAGANGAGPPGSAPPTGLTNANSVDLNDNHLATESRGWIGSPTTPAGILPYRAPWIEVLRDPTQAPQPDPNSPNYNPVIGRYAYWIEDETSKLDVSRVGNVENGGAFRRGDGIDIPTNIPPKFAVNDLDIGALPLIAGAPLPPGDTATNGGIINFRATIPMLGARFLNRVGGQLVPDVHETTKFYGTVFGLSNDLAGNGRRRANLNALVTSPANPNAAVAAGIIAGNIDDIAYVISGRHLIGLSLGPAPLPDDRVFRTAPDNYANTLSTFGSRFWTSTPTPVADQQNMYLERIATNIRDYIDADQQPTYVDTSDQVQSGTRVTLAWRSGSEPRALGKEAIPYLQEHGWAGLEASMSGSETTTPRSYNVQTDEYLEFYNPYTKDFTAPAGTIITIYNRPSWDAGTYPALQLPDLDLDVSGQIFPAGQAIVVTTAPAGTDPSGLLRNSNVVRVTVNNSLREFSGTTDHRCDGRGYGTPGPYGLELFGRSGSTHLSDYATEMVWGTANGIFDAHAYLGFGGTTSSHTVWDYVGDITGRPIEIGSTSRFVYTASLRGNDQPSRTGDARSLSEQLSMSAGVSTLGNDQTRFYGNIDGDGNIPATSTFGLAAISFVNPTSMSQPWPDYNPALADTGASAYAIIRDGPLQSIGELGYIYDPKRVIATSPGSGNPPADILQARGGARTLKIGQPDDLITGARFSPNWFNGAWRLADLFSADLTRDPSNNFVVVSNPTSRGKVNINGVQRDNGVAFRAALRGFNFLASPDSDPQLNGQALSNADIDNLITSIQSYLATNGPMMERGEISQLSFFNTSASLNGHSISTTNDRGREEIFRRMVEMVTTRSASFTVYAIGEAIRQDRSGTVNTVGQKRLAITFQLDPQVNGMLLRNSTIPSDAATSYKIQKVYAPN